MRRFIPLLALTLAGCAAASAGDGETRVIQTTDLVADRLLGEAAVCRYPGVSKTLGKGAAATVTIAVPAKADLRYQCLAAAMAARAEDVPTPTPTPAP